MRDKSAFRHDCYANGNHFYVRSPIHPSPILQVKRCNKSRHKHARNQPKSQASSFCFTIFGCGLFIVLIIVVAIAVLSVYIGLEVFVDGTFRVTFGDDYYEELHDHSSPLYVKKARQYEFMLEKLFTRSVLGPAVKQCIVMGFANGSLVVFFRIVLDKRKISNSLSFGNLEDMVRKIILDDVTSKQPAVFGKIRIDPQDIQIKRYSSQETETLPEKSKKLSYSYEQDDEPVSYIIRGANKKPSDFSQPMSPDFDNRKHIQTHRPRLKPNKTRKLTTEKQKNRGTIVRTAIKHNEITSTQKPERFSFVSNDAEYEKVVGKAEIEVIEGNIENNLSFEVGNNIAPIKSKNSNNERNDTSSLAIGKKVESLQSKIFKNDNNANEISFDVKYGVPKENENLARKNSPENTNNIVNDTETNIEKFVSDIISKIEPSRSKRKGFIGPEVGGNPKNVKKYSLVKKQNEVNTKSINEDKLNVGKIINNSTETNENSKKLKLTSDLISEERSAYIYESDKNENSNSDDFSEEKIINNHSNDDVIPSDMILLSTEIVTSTSVEVSVNDKKPSAKDSAESFSKNQTKSDFLTILSNSDSDVPKSSTVKNTQNVKNSTLAKFHNLFPRSAPYIINNSAKINKAENTTPFVRNKRKTITNPAINPTVTNSNPENSTFPTKFRILKPRSLPDSPKKRNVTNHQIASKISKTPLNFRRNFTTVKVLKRNAKNAKRNATAPVTTKIIKKKKRPLLSSNSTVMKIRNPKNSTGVLFQIAIPRSIAEESPINNSVTDKISTTEQMPLNELINKYKSNPANDTLQLIIDHLASLYAKSTQAALTTVSTTPRVTKFYPITKVWNKIPTIPADDQSTVNRLPTSTINPNETCPAESYTCIDSKMCIKQNQLCNAIYDCPLGDDERNCMTIAPSSSLANDVTYFSAGHVMVRRSGKWGKLCFEKNENEESISHDLSPEIGQFVCRALTYKIFENAVKVPDDEKITGVVDENRPMYYKLTEISKNFSGPIRRKHFKFMKTKCRSKQVLKISCSNLQCGVQTHASGTHPIVKNFERRSRIVGGGSAALGAWPWQAALYKEGEYQCGATLINENWLLSAGHCFYNTLDEYWVARLGIVRRGSSSPSPLEQLRTLRRIILHPGYVDSGFVNDISLLEMDTPIQFSNVVRPICLPVSIPQPEDGTMCTVIGWGQLMEIGRIFPDTLQEVQLPLISTTECKKRTAFLPLYKITDNMICAGYDRGGRDACLGDSGGGIFCENGGSWYIQGVTSNGYGCARAHRPGVYTKVSNYIGWIHQVMGKPANYSLWQRKTQPTCAGHRCPLGECLPKARICNSYAECSDGSDELGC